MKNEQVNKIKEASRLKILFTVESTNPLTFRLFTLRGLFKMKRNMDMIGLISDDNKEQIQDRWQNPKVKAYYKKVVKTVKPKRKKK